MLIFSLVISHDKAALNASLVNNVKVVYEIRPEDNISTEKFQKMAYDIQACMEDNNRSVNVAKRKALGLRTIIVDVDNAKNADEIINELSSLEWTENYHKASSLIGPGPQPSDTYAYLTTYAENN